MIKFGHLSVLICLLAMFMLPATRTEAGKTSTSNPVEVGDVNWQRDFAAALAQSKTTGKPVFAFFQEVPGCAGCQQFGREVLKKKLLVEAIETEFIPVLIYNNRPGPDAEILKRYREPAWNYQVIRFLDHLGSDLIPRKDRVWTLHPLATRMIEALRKAKRPVPGYLEALAQESQPKSALRTMAFAMHCFWTGERVLGQLDGVIDTEAGWLEGREVTRVVYNPKQIDAAALVTHARRHRCADKIYLDGPDQAELGKQVKGVPVGPLASGYRPARRSDQKKQIQRTPFEQLNLSLMQATKVNAHARGNREEAVRWLSPSQRARLTSSQVEPAR